MKIIRSFCLITVCLGTATLLHAQQAQDIKTEIAKPVQVNIPQAENKPSPQPVFTAQPGITLKPDAPATVNETPSPFKKDEKNKVTEPAKLTMKLVDENQNKKTLSAEDNKTLNGVSEKPKHLAAATANDAQAAKPLSLVAPAIVKPNEN